MFVQSFRGAFMRASYPAYRRAFYRSNAGGRDEIEIRVGKKTPALDDVLQRSGKRRWAFLTACNPGARRLSAAENRARTRALESDLRNRRFFYFLGRSGADAGDWTEEASFLVIGIARREADRLRRRFGQDAFVTGVSAGAARLWPA
jgi:hypothetical protein